MADRKIYTHNKRGGRYEIVTDTAHLQCSTHEHFESLVADLPWTVYRNVETGAVYLRMTAEFMDGRFSEVPDV